MHFFSLKDIYIHFKLVPYFSQTLLIRFCDTDLVKDVFFKV